MPLVCPECGNETSFQVKTRQLHLMPVEKDGLDVAEDGRPAGLEMLYDQCETAVGLDDLDIGPRRDLGLSFGARGYSR